MSTPKIDEQQIRRTLEALLAPGQVTEVRAFDALKPGSRDYRVNVSGYYTDPDDLVRDARTIDAEGVYFVPNPVRPDLLARAKNRLRWKVKTGEATTDDHVTARRWLLVDVDATDSHRLKITATDDEHEAALTLAHTITSDLWETDWPKPILADSGNGAHLLYRVDLPNDDDARELAKRCLEALDFRFSTDVVDVDTKTFNAARIWKLYGTQVRKGDEIPGRPHRMARLVDVPDPVEVVPRELLEDLAASLPEEPESKARARQTTTTSTTREFNLADWIAEHLPDARGPHAWKQGRKWILPACPFNADHARGEAYVVQDPTDGPIAAGCQHNSCTWKWADLRDKFEPEARERREAREARQQQGAPVDEEYLRREGWDGQDPPSDDAPHPGEKPGDVDPFEGTWRTLAEWRGDGKSWLDVDAYPPRRKWLLTEPGKPEDDLAGLLPRGKVGMLVAAGAAGKTMALCELALCVATGRSWFKHFPVKTPGRVLLALGEEDTEEAHRRLNYAADMLGIGQEAVPEAEQRIVVLPLTGHPDMALTQEPDNDGKVETDAARAMLRHLADTDEEGWALIILDPASRFAGPDVEKDNAAATRFVQVLEKLAAVQGKPAVLVAHHTSQAARGSGTAAATHARGVTGLSDAVRWQAELQGRGKFDGIQRLDFTVTKNNYSGYWPLVFLLRDEDKRGMLRRPKEAEEEKWEAAHEAAEKEKEREAFIRAAVKKGAAGGKILGRVAADAAKAFGEIDGAVKAALEGKGTVEQAAENGDGEGKAGKKKRKGEQRPLPMKLPGE